MNHRTLLLAAVLLGACAQTEAPDEPLAGERGAGTVQQPTNTAAPAAPSLPTPPIAPEAPNPNSAGACQMQDGEELKVQAVKALGTEPFWGARTEGRCVTYSTPEDQKGTRIWTHVDTGPQGPVWNGTLRGRQFQLYVKTSTGCSDGMSDKTYPLEAILRVDGETRRGCAEPL